MEGTTKKRKSKKRSQKQQQRRQQWHRAWSAKFARPRAAIAGRGRERKREGFFGIFSLFRPVAVHWPRAATRAFVFRFSRSLVVDRLSGIYIVSERVCTRLSLMLFSILSLCAPAFVVKFMRACLKGGNALVRLPFSFLKRRTCASCGVKEAFGMMFCQ